MHVKWDIKHQILDGNKAWILCWELVPHFYGFLVAYAHTGKWMQLHKFINNLLYILLIYTIYLNGYEGIPSISGIFYFSDSLSVSLNLFK